MKTLLLILSMLPLSALSQAWPQYRSVSNKVYNVSLAPGWFTLTPVGASVVSPLDKTKPTMGQAVKVAWSEAQPSARRIEVVNVPYDPNNFRDGGRFVGMQAKSFPFRAMLLETKTNYTTKGTVQSIHQFYDYGVKAK